jgi:RNA polymerase sigma factor (sigma-70 family)
MELWLAELGQGRPEAAWDLFVERYRGLMIATIRRLIRDHDDVMDVFSSACEALRIHDCARLRQFRDQADGGARVTTWLVVVVRNLTIDWLRRRDGRDRRAPPAHLSAIQQQIYAEVVLEGRSHVEAYEVIARSESPMSFAAFLREVRETYRLAPQACHETPRRPPRAAAPEPRTEAGDDGLAAAESARRLNAALATLPPDSRLAVQLFVTDGMPAAEVARAVGWPNAKAVYNRVRRALAVLRSTLERAGIGLDELR